MLFLYPVTGLHATIEVPQYLWLPHWCLLGRDTRNAQTPDFYFIEVLPIGYLFRNWHAVSHSEQVFGVCNYEHFTLTWHAVPVTSLEKNRHLSDAWEGKVVPLLN
jgi:hypothetical protein